MHLGAFHESDAQTPPPPITRVRPTLPILSGAGQLTRAYVPRPRGARAPPPAVAVPRPSAAPTHRDSRCPCPLMAPAKSRCCEHADRSGHALEHE